MDIRKQHGDLVWFWHGSRRWEGSPELRGPRAQRAEWGCGLYLTTRYMTALKYAKGGGATMLFGLDPAARKLEGLRISIDEMRTAVRGIARLQKRDLILEDIERNVARNGKGEVGLNVLVNLAVNHDAMVGAPAVAISEFVASQGADISVGLRTAGEQWVVVFNPKVIRKFERVSASRVQLNDYELPYLEQQLQAMQALREEVDDEPAQGQGMGC